MDVDNLLEDSKQWASWKDHLCNACKKRIKDKMKGVANQYNKGGMRRKLAELKLAAYSTTLWRVLCMRCLRTIKKKVRES